MAVQVEGADYFNTEYRMPNPREILGYCPGIVITVSRGGHLKDDGRGYKNEALQLAHSSVREYLMDAQLTADTSLDVGLRQSLQDINAKSIIAQVCLAYLLYLNFDLTTEELIKEFPFVQYSSRYWMAFAKEAWGESETLKTLIERLFCDTHSSFKNCYKLHLPDRPWLTEQEIKVIKMAPPLYYASLGGFVDIVELLIVNGADVNGQGGYYGNALCAAMESGQDQIVELLLRNDADANRQSDDCETALCIASRNGQSRTVSLLLESGAQINMQHGHYGSALCAAACSGQLKIVQQLLESGAEVNAQSGDYGSALRAAEENGHGEIAELLCIHGADHTYYASDENDRTTLSEDGWYEDLNPDRNAESVYIHELPSPFKSVSAELKMFTTETDYHRKVLLKALEHNDVEVVELSQQQDADIELGVLDEDCANALCDALDRRQSNIVKILLRSSVNVLREDYGDALYKASREGQDEILELLLEKDIKYELHYKYYIDAFGAAILNCCADTASSLFEAGGIFTRLGLLGLSETDRNHDRVLEALLTIIRADLTPDVDGIAHHSNNHNHNHTILPTLVASSGSAQRGPSEEICLVEMSQPDTGNEVACTKFEDDLNPSPDDGADKHGLRQKSLVKER
ncbi:Ankyrin-2 [Drechslerella dactyloides]|uniref:Ankyrin-2 n=1 Tax=Drechslerella dactyloides TaxID=74499 RepID=A0AAD6J8C8_DREDA|nr:Ankyrin-2 [Drechslerella dactyloides]